MHIGTEIVDEAVVVRIHEYQFLEALVGIFVIFEHEIVDCKQDFDTFVVLIRILLVIAYQYGQ